MRQRGLGKAERGRRGPERPEFGDGQDRLELAQAQPAFDRLYRSQLRHSLTLTQVSLTLNWPMSQTGKEDIVLRAARTTAEGRLFRLLIGALILVSAAAQFALVPVMPVYAHRLGLSGFEQGMVLGATGLATLVVSVPAGDPGRPVRRPAYHAGRGPADGGGDRGAGAGRRLPGPVRRPAGLRGRVRHGVDRGPVLAGRRHGRRPARPGRLGGQRRRRRRRRARDLRRARPEPGAGRPVAGHRGHLRRDHRRAGGAPGAAGTGRALPGTYARRTPRRGEP